METNMSNAFNTETTGAEIDYANLNVQSLDDVLAIAGQAGELDRKGGKVARAKFLRNMIDYVATGALPYVKTKAGAKAATAEKSPVQSVVERYLDEHPTAVKDGSGSFRNLLSQFNKVAEYASLGAARAAGDTVDTALAMAEAARAKAAGEKGARKPQDDTRIIHSVAKLATDKDHIKVAAPLSAEALETCIYAKKGPGKDFIARVTAMSKALSEDDDAPTGDEKFDAIIDAFTAYLESVAEETETKAKVAEFIGENGILAALKAAGVVKENKSGSVTIDVNKLATVAPTEA